LLVLLPAWLGKLYYQRFLEQKFATAWRLARLISWLHPADGWRNQPEIVRALDLAQRGDLTAALKTLKRFEGIKSSIGLAAITNLYRLTNQWEELLAWHARHRQEVAPYPQLLPVFLRAFGETGDLRGLVDLYEVHRRQIGRLIPAASRDLCRLMLFAFCGKRQLVEGLFAGNLRILPAPVREFWLATADSGAGASESAQHSLELLLPQADPSMRAAIQRRLSRIRILPDQPDAVAEDLIQSAALEHGHDESFGARPSLFSKQARGTRILILVNVILFTAEIYFGGGTNGVVLYRLGGLFPPAVHAGQWWRLLTSLFLHLGALHLAMNMFALWLLGPFAEAALGFLRFLLVYLLAGIGSMGVVVTFASGPHGQQLTVGASGCIMGIVGATGALMLRGWLREKALSAKRRLIGMVVIVAMQTVFDSVVTQVSMAAHLSGAIIGFVITLVLRDRLWSPAPYSPATESEAPEDV
jgi:rhomboid protease GluP